MADQGFGGLATLGEFSGEEAVQSLRKNGRADVRPDVLATFGESCREEAVGTLGGCDDVKLTASRSKSMLQHYHWAFKEAQRQCARGKLQQFGARIALEEAEKSVECEAPDPHLMSAPGKGCQPSRSSSSEVPPAPNVEKRKRIRAAASSSAEPIEISEADEDDPTPPWTPEVRIPGSKCNLKTGGTGRAWCRDCDEANSFCMFYRRYLM